MLVLKDDNKSNNVCNFAIF